MSDAAAFLKSEIDRVGAQVAALEVQREAVRHARASIAERIEAIAGQPAADAAAAQALDRALARLRIEDEQAEEHERLLDHQIGEAGRRLDALAEDIQLIEDSSIV